MIDLERVLCPVDFSEFSRRALDHALGVARCYGSTVTVLHVVPSMPVVTPVPYYFGAEKTPPMTLPPIDRAEVAAQLARFVGQEDVPGVHVDPLVGESLHVYSEILTQADRLDADLIVMGTHGRSGFESLFLGSTAEKVLRKSKRPVMTVPPKAPEVTARGRVPFTRILCAVDFSTCSNLALDYAMSLAKAGGGALTVLHVVEFIPLYYDFTPPAVADVTAWSKDAQRQLHGMVPDAVRSECSVKEVVATGKPYREILSLAHDVDADAIVLGIQGRNAADLMFFGSTTHHVVREARCAVLTLRE